MTPSPDSASNGEMDASIQKLTGPRTAPLEMALVLLLSVAATINGAVAFWCL